MSKSHSVVQKRILKASPEDIWDALTKPDLMQQWFCPLGMTTIEVEADVQLGRTFRIVMDARAAAMKPPPEMGNFVTAYGSYLRVEPPHRLEFSWTWQGRDETSRVSVSLTPKGEYTELVLVHDELKDEASRIFHEDGWTPTLDNLCKYLGHQEALADGQ